MMHAPRLAIAFLLLFLVTFLRLPTGTASDTLRSLPDANEELAAYMGAIERCMPERVRDALARIPSLPRRLLALKYYMKRTAEEIERKWAWSREDAVRYRSSEEYRATLDELAKIRSAFAAMNPGYRLEAKVEIRSFGAQLGKWNSTRSIGGGGAELIDAATAFLSDTAAIDSIEGENRLSRFIGFLMSFEPKQSPTVALPGLSQHGQFRAFDFRVMKGSRVVAGAVSGTIATRWDGAGWTERLREAICTTSNRFDGPLPAPYEPWHYAYLP